MSVSPLNPLKGNSIYSTLKKNYLIMKHYTYIIFLSLFYCSCNTEPTNSTNNLSTNQTSISSSAILIFKKEKQLEIWNDGAKINTYPINLDSKFPIGEFEATNSKKGIKIHFPNQFYKEKSYQIDFDPIIKVTKNEFIEIDLTNIPILVFPNDARNGQSFVASFSSPHWMCEIYAKMNLYLLEYN